MTLFATVAEPLKEKLKNCLLVAVMIWIACQERQASAQGVALVKI